MLLVLVLSLLLRPTPLYAQATVGSSLSESGDVLTTHDGRGHIATVYNQFNGTNHTIHITKITANGSVLWTIQHADNYYEKAYAAVMDLEGNLYIAGMRQWQDQKNFLILKILPYSQLHWEVQDNWSTCKAVSVAVDVESNVLAAGVCRTQGTFPARLVKYNSQGGLLWAQNYDGGGRNYVRSLQTDYRGDISIVVETVFGNYSDGSYITQTITYDKWGQQVAIRR